MTLVVKIYLELRRKTIISSQQVTLQFRHDQLTVSCSNGNVLGCSPLFSSLIFAQRVYSDVAIFCFNVTNSYCQHLTRAKTYYFQ
jgi:hypothetical protein